MIGLRSAALAAACLVAVAASARAQERLVVTAYGGVWKESVEKNFAACYTQRTGQRVAIQTGESNDWLSRIRANPGKPPIDVVTMAQSDTMRAIQDGLLDVFIVHPLSRLGLISVFPRVFAGEHVDHPAVEFVRARRVRLEADGIVAYADGERIGALPIEVEVVPGALSVFA